MYEKQVKCLNSGTNEIFENNQLMNWFTCLDAKTIINDEVDAKPLWTPLRGGNISFKIEDSSADIKQSEWSNQDGKGSFIL